MYNLIIIVDGSTKYETSAQPHCKRVNLYIVIQISFLPFSFFNVSHFHCIQACLYNYLFVSFSYSSFN